MNSNGGLSDPADGTAAQVSAVAKRYAQSLMRAMPGNAKRQNLSSPYKHLSAHVGTDSAVKTYTNGGRPPGIKQST